MDWPQTKSRMQIDNQRNESRHTTVTLHCINAASLLYTLQHYHCITSVSLSLYHYCIASVKRQLNSLLTPGIEQSDADFKTFLLGERLICHC